MLEVNLSPKRSPEDHCSSEQRGRDGDYKVTAFVKMFPSGHITQ